MRPNFSTIKQGPVVLPLLSFFQTSALFWAVWRRESSPGRSWNDLPSSKCIDLPWEGPALSSLPSLGHFLPWGLCLASLLFPQPQPCPILGSPSWPGRWIRLWFPSSCFTWKCQQGAQVQSSPWVSPPQPCLLLHTHPTSSIDATHSMAETVHVPVSNHPSPPTAKSHPHFFNLAGTGWSASQPLWLPSFHVQPGPQGPALLWSQGKATRSGWALVPTVVTLLLMPPLWIAREQWLLTRDEFASQGTFIWRQFWLSYLGQGVLLASREYRPGMLINMLQASPHNQELPGSKCQQNVNLCKPQNEKNF